MFFNSSFFSVNEEFFCEAITPEHFSVKFYFEPQRLFV